MVVRVVQQSEMMTKIPPLAKLMDAMRDAYEEFSAGHAYVADVQHVHVEPHDEDDEGGHACVKSGYIKGKASWVVKVAGGFPGNAALGLSNSQGCMLLFSQTTGELETILLDNGHLTDGGVSMHLEVRAGKGGVAIYPRDWCCCEARRRIRRRPGLRRYYCFLAHVRKR